MIRARAWWMGLALAFLGAAGVSSDVLGQAQAAPPQRSARGGVYTAEQAREGEAIFEQHCLRCHSAQEYRSPRFRAKWASRTLQDLYLLMSATMPLDQPASLLPRQYAELLAYVLELNGFPPGEAALGWDEGELAAITIDPPGR